MLGTRIDASKYINCSDIFMTLLSIEMCLFNAKDNWNYYLEARMMNKQQLNRVTIPIWVEIPPPQRTALKIQFQFIVKNLRSNLMRMATITTCDIAQIQTYKMNKDSKSYVIDFECTVRASSMLRFCASVLNPKPRDDGIFKRFLKVVKFLPMLISACVWIVINCDVYFKETLYIFELHHFTPFRSFNFHFF